MDRRRAAGALLALAACIACSAAAPTASNHTALDMYEAAPEGCFYNFQHYGEGDRIMTNEPCLNCTCHNRMLMCYLRVCPFTKPIGQDCTVEKRADQCCPIVTCPDVPVDLLTSTSTSSPAEYGATGVGKLDRYGCSINGRYFSEGSKVPSTPNKPCEHCYCIRNMTTCVMQECTLHVDGCTPIYHKDVCCPVRYSCDHPEDEIPLLDDMTTTVRPTPGFLLTTTTMAAVTQMTQDCVHDDKIFADGALIKTEKACEHCYCMKGDIVCVVQECGTPMENEGKNCTSLPPREGQCCPDTYICEGDDLTTELAEEFTTEAVVEKTTTLSPPRRVGVEGSGYRNEPDYVSYTQMPFTEPETEGSGDEYIKEEKPQDIDVAQSPILPEEKLTTLEAIPQYISTTAPVTESFEKESTEEKTSEHDYASSATTIPELHEHKVPESTNTEATTSHEIDSSQPESVVPSITEDEEKETTKSEVQDIVTEKITEEESVLPHKDIATTTSASNIEEIERSTTAVDSQVSVTGGIPEEAYEHHNYASSTTNGPDSDEEGVTTDSYKESYLDSTEKSDQEISKPSKFVPSATSTPFLEEVEKASTDSSDGQNIVTNIVIEEHSEPHVDVITTGVPTLDENVKATEPNVDTDTTAETDTVKDSIEPHKHDTSATVDLSEEVAKTTTVYDEKESATTESSVTEGYKPHKHIQSTTITSASDGSDEDTTYTGADNSNTDGTTELGDSDNDVIKETSNIPITEEIVTETVKPDRHIADETTEKETYKPEEKITTLKTTISDITEETSELTGGFTEQMILESDVTTNVPAQDNYKTTTQIAEENLITHDNLEKVDVVSNEYVPMTTSMSLPEESEKATIEPAKFAEKLSTETIFETPKPHTTEAPFVEENDMVTTDTYREDEHISGEITDHDDSKPTEYGSSTSSTPFLEEIEKVTTDSHEDHVSHQVNEHASNKPHGQETSTLVTDEVPSEPDKGINTIPSEISEEDSTQSSITEKTDLLEEHAKPIQPTNVIDDKQTYGIDVITTEVPLYSTSSPVSFVTKEDLYTVTTEPSFRKEDDHNIKIESQTDIGPITTVIYDQTERAPSTITHPESTEAATLVDMEIKPTISSEHYTHDIDKSTHEVTTEISEPSKHIELIKPEKESTAEIEAGETYTTPAINKFELPETTTINLGENEIHEDTTLSHGRIPGEGDCLLNGITYINESTVPSTNKCTSGCRCISSIIKCDPIICSPPPEYMDNCQPVYDSPESCCPTYICDQLRETLPPLPHIKVTTPETPELSSTIECKGNQCESSEDKREPTIPSEEKGDTTQCQSEGCIKQIEQSVHSVPTSEHPELCADGKCAPTGEGCANGECLPIDGSAVIPCEGDSCVTTPESLPHVSQPCVNDETCKQVKVPEITSVPCEGETCTNVKEDCNSSDCSTTVVSPPEDNQQHSVSCEEQGGCKETQDNKKECGDGSCGIKETLDSEGIQSHCSGLSCDEPAIDPTQHNKEPLPIDTSKHEQTTKSSVVDESQLVTTESPKSHETEKHTVPESPQLSTISVTEKTVPPEIPELEESITKMPVHVDTSYENDVTKETETAPIESDTKLPESVTSVYTTPEGAIVEKTTEIPSLDIEKDILTSKVPEEHVTEISEIHTKEADTLIAETNTETMAPQDESHTESQTYISDVQSSLAPEAPNVNTVVPGEQIISDQQESVTKASDSIDSELTESHVTQPQEEPEDTKLEKETKTPEATISEHESTTKTSQEIITEPIITEYEVTTTKSPENLITSAVTAETGTEENIEESSVQPEHTPDLAEHIETNKQELTTESSMLEITLSNKDGTETYVDESQDKTESPLYQMTESQELHTNTEQDIITEDVIKHTTQTLPFESEQDKISPTLSESHTDETETLGSGAATTEREIFSTKNEEEPQVTKPQEPTQSKPEIEIISAPPTPPADNVEPYSSTEPEIYENIKTESPVSLGTEVEPQTSQHGDDELRTTLPDLLTTKLPGRTTKVPHGSENQYTHTESTSSYETMTEVPQEQIDEHEIRTDSPDLPSFEKEKLSTEMLSTVNPEKIYTGSGNVHTTVPEISITEKITPSISEEEIRTELPDKVKENIEPTIAETPTDVSRTPVETSTAPSVEISTKHEEDEHNMEKVVPSEEEVYIPVKPESSNELTHTEESTEAELPEKTTVDEDHNLITDTPQLGITTSADIPEYTSTQTHEIDEETPQHPIVQPIQTDLPTISTEAPEIITTQQFDKVTDISEATTPKEEQSSDVHVPLVTEPQEISTKPTNIQITEPQKSVTEIVETSTEKQIETKESETETPITDKESVTDSQKYLTEIPTTFSAQTEIPDLHKTTLETQDTVHDHENSATESVIPVIISSDKTEHPHGITQIPESMITGLEEFDTSLPPTSVSDHKKSETETTKLMEPIETSTKIILEQENVDSEEKITRAPEILSPKKEGPISHETHTTPQETITEIQRIPETNTELVMQPTESQQEITQPPPRSEQTSKPEYEHTETTPYLIELEEHTHKIFEETTMTPVEDDKTPSLTDVNEIEDANIPLEITTEKHAHDQSDLQKETTPAQEQTPTENQTTVLEEELEKSTHSPTTMAQQAPEKSTDLPIAAPENVPETSTDLPVAMPEEVPEKSTDLPVAVPEEVPEKSTDLPVAAPEAVPEKATDLPVAAPEEGLEKSTDLPVAVQEEEPVKSTDLPVAAPEEVPEKSTDLPVAAPEEVPEKSTDSPVAAPEQVPDKSTDLPVAVPEEPEKSTDLPVAAPGEEESEISTDLPVAVPGEEVPEKSTDLPVAVPEEEPEKSTDLPVAMPHEEPEKSTDLPVPAPEEVPEKSTDLPVPVAEEEPEKSTDLPVAAPEEVPEKSTDLPVVMPHEEPEESSDLPLPAPEGVPEKSTDLPVVMPHEEPEESTDLPLPAPEEVPEKSTDLPVVMPHEEPEESTDLPVPAPEEVPEKSTDLPVAVPEEVPEKSTDLPVARPHEEPEESTDLPLPAPEEVPEKSTDLPVAVPEEEPEKSTDLPVAVPEEEPEKSTDLPVAAPEEVPEKSTDLPVVMPHEEPEESTDLPLPAPEGVPEKSTDLPVAVPEEEPEKSTGLPVTAPEEEPEKSTDLPVTTPEEPEKSTGLPVGVPEEEPEKSTVLPIAVPEGKPEEPTQSPIEDTFSETTKEQTDKAQDSIDLEKEITTSLPTQHTETEKVPPTDSDMTEQTEKDISLPEVPMHPTTSIETSTTVDEEHIHVTTKASTAYSEEVSTQASVPTDKLTQPDEKPSELPSAVPELPKPVPSDAHQTGDVLPEEDGHFPPSGGSGYGGEDYGEEDQAFGPGTCRYGGKVYVSAQQIPRDDPCDFCFCFRSDIICLQQSCPPPIHGCHEEPIQGFCCPRYECPVSMATTLNVTTTTTTTTTTLPPHFPTHSYKGAAQRRGCQIKGHTYKVGEVVRASSGPCLHCTCGGDGQMKCDPKACTPEPMLRQMIAAAVSAKRRR